MSDLLRTFLSDIPNLSPEDRDALCSHLVTETYAAGRILQEEGKVPHHCFFVLKGCIRQYRMVEGEDRTMEFYAEDHGVVSSACYVDQRPSDFNLICVEETVCLVGELERDQQLYAQFPVLEQVTRVMMEREWHRTQTDFAAFVAASPEQRYLQLLEARPGLFQRAPLHQIASYLGMTPESLSRIRKRLAQRS